MVTLLLLFAVARELASAPEPFAISIKVPHRDWTTTSAIGALGACILLVTSIALGALAGT